MKYKILLSLFFTGIIASSIAQSGKPDITFGTDGFVKTHIGGRFDYDKSVVTLLGTSCGSLYSISSANGAIIISKVNSDGLIDPSYGVNGFTAPLKLNLYQAEVQSDGKLVMVGFIDQQSYDQSEGSIEIVRFNKDGNLDKTFNNTGKLLVNSTFLSGASLFKVQPDGKILAGYLFEFGSEVILQRFNQDGSQDASFNHTGNVTFNDVDFIPSSLCVQNDGKIVIVGLNRNSSGIFQTEFIRLNSDGTTDNTLNGTGQVILDASFSGINTCAIQSDGKILLAGSATDIEGKSGFFVARFNVNGSPDNTFGNLGKQITAFTGRNSVATSIGVKNDGTIILGGYTALTDNDFAIATYNCKGILQKTNISDFGSSNNDIAGNLVIQDNGKVVLLGTTKNANNITKLAAAKYNVNVKLDDSFSDNGKLVIQPIRIHPYGNTNFKATAIQSDGKIVVAGYAWNGNTTDFAVARYNTDGSPDNSFSNNGKELTDFNVSADTANAIAIRSDGKIIVAGASGNHLAMAWYNQDGSLYSKNVSGVFAPATSIALQQDGKLLVNCQSVLLRYDMAGVLDAGFGASGLLQTPFQFDPFICNAFILQTDGKIIVAGDPGGGFADFILARFNADGSPDNTFGTNGSVTSGTFIPGPFGAPNPQVNTIVIQSDGKIVVSGTTIPWYRSTNHDIFTARFNADGSFDKNFESYEPNLVNSDIRKNFGTSLVIQPDDKVITGGYIYDGASDNFTILRYNTDGTLDNTFNNIGLTSTLGTYADNGVNALALSNNTLLYAVGFGQFPANLGVVARYNLVSGTSPVAVSHEITKINSNRFKVSVMPNPAQTFFNIFVSGNTSDAVTVTITDVSGKLMQIKSNEKINSNIVIGSQLPAGIYFVQVRQGSQSTTLKLVKQ